MSIDTTGKWWIGSEPSEIGGFLEAYSSDGDCKIHEFRLSRCQCGSVEFSLTADDDEGVAQRICTKCKSAHFICDSEEFWNVSSPEKWSCIECKSDQANVGIGFSLYPNDHEIKWIYVGCRCAMCGILGCFAGWKVAYTPSRHLIEQA